MAIDEDHDDGQGGRSRARREITASWRWGVELVELPAWHRRILPLTDDVKRGIEVAISITSPTARNRQIAWIDGAIRDLDDEEKDALRLAIDRPPWDADPDVATTHWCARIRGGDEGIEAFLAEHPEIERQRLRNLARNGRAGALEKMVRQVLAGD